MEQLLGKPIVENIKKDTEKRLSKFNLSKDSYLAILFFWDNSSSHVYVKMKKKYGESIGLKVKVFGQNTDEFPDGSQYSSQYNNYKTPQDIINLIEDLNKDNNCLWIIVQLPIPDQIREHQPNILSKIDWKKDVDWLGGIVNGLSQIWLLDFIPATPKAIIKLLEWYNLNHFEWKNIAILWQSNLVWKSLAIELMKQWWTILSFNHMSDQDKMREFCKQADYIIACTGAIHLVDESFLNPDKQQILVDAWYGHKDGKAVWDINFEAVENKVKYLAPVPWWVWPLTVACLFDNLVELLETEK